MQIQEEKMHLLYLGFVCGLWPANFLFCHKCIALWRKEAAFAGRFCFFLWVFRLSSNLLTCSAGLQM